MKKLFLPAFIVVLLFPALATFAGVTGKISGTITDFQSAEPLPGVNVVLEGTTIGAATDLDGYYVILNVPPGRYNLKATFIGYSSQRITDVVVKIDLTSQIDIKLKAEILAGEEVVVVAERPVVQRDISSSQANVEARQIETLPLVTSAAGIVGLQAGAIGLSIRGGGSDQTAFMVDGATLRDERNNSPITGVSLSAIQEVQIQTGGFNAEYGNIRSGIVNVVTREGDRDRYSGALTVRYSPARQKHFGPSFYDPNSYWLRPFLDPVVAWNGTKNGEPFEDSNANGSWDAGEPFTDYNGDGARSFWDANTQKQYQQFDGWNLVSQRTLQDKDPNNDLTPAGAQRLYMWQHRRQGDIEDPDYNIDAGLGGPVPLVGDYLGDLRFFASYRREQDLYVVPFSRDRYGEDNYLLKLTSDITGSMKLTVSALYNEILAVSDNDIGDPGFYRTTNSVANVLTQVGFIDSRIFYPNYWATTDVYRNMFSVKFTHVLGPNTFYEAFIERVGSNYKTLPGTPRDTSRVYEIVDGYFVDEAPFGLDERLIYGQGGLLMGVRANARDFSKISTVTAKFDLSSQINHFNLLKAGVEFVYNDFNMKYGAVNNILPTERPWTVWRRYPLRGAIYLQDKLEFKGFISNMGLRMDFIDPRGAWYDVDPYDQAFFSTDFDPESRFIFRQVQVDKQVTFSPRLGVSHPITVNSKLYFNYGHFRQMPISERLYTERRITGNQLNRLGDPNLPLQKTVAYELGYEHSLFNSLLVRLAGYYKDVTDQPALTRYQSANGKVRYEKATSNSYEDIRGLEATVEKRVGRWLTGFANYTYTVSSSGYFGLRRYFENPAEQREDIAQNPPDQEKPISRPYFRSNVVLHTPEDFGPVYFGLNPLADWRLSALATWRAGRHFTWNPVTVPEIVNNAQWKDDYDVDLRINRDIALASVVLSLFIDINNVFNFKRWQMGSDFSFSPTGFVDGQDYNDYMFSLRLPESITGPLRYTPINGNGNDRPGDYRPDDVAFDPLEPNPNNDPAIAARNAERIKNKSYIDNPNQTYLQFLNPRDVFFGAKLTFNL